MGYFYCEKASDSLGQDYICTDKFGPDAAFASSDSLTRHERMCAPGWFCDFKSENSDSGVCNKCPSAASCCASGVCLCTTAELCAANINDKKGLDACKAMCSDTPGRFAPFVGGELCQVCAAGMHQRGGGAGADMPQIRYSVPNGAILI